MSKEEVGTHRSSDKPLRAESRWEKGDAEVMALKSGGRAGLGAWADED